MKTILQIVFCLLIMFDGQAQSPAYRHSIGIGLESVGLDAPDGGGARYLVRYARHLHKDRIALLGSLGYINALNRNYLVNDAYVDGKRRERVTADLTAAFDFIRHSRHAFRIGVGPSLWYRQDELLNGARFTIDVITGEVTNVRAQWRQEKEVNFGYNVLVEYEYALTQQLLVSGKLKFFDSRQAGQSSIYGFGLGYRLP